MEIEIIDEAEFNEAAASVGQKGQWTSLVNEITEDGQPRKISGLSRGQVSALYRRAKEAGLQVVASYKNGTVYIKP